MTTIRKKILAGITILGLALGTWLYILKRRRNKLEVPDNANIKDLKLELSKAKNNTKVGLELDAINKKLKASAAVPFNKPMWLLNYAEGDFANPNFVPFSNFISGERFSKANFEANLKAMDELIGKENEEVTRQSEAWKVPRYLIFCIKAIENFTADTNAIGGSKAKFTKDTYTGKTLEYNQAVGKMMIKPYTATDSLRIAMKVGVLQESQANMLQTLANSPRLDKALSKTDLGDIVITRELLEISEFNHAVGAAKIATSMLQYNTEIYKIMAQFNQGEYFISNNRLNSYKTFESFLSHLKNSEVIEYVKNACGKYGALDIIINHLGITD